jgi:hypothetical protein
MNEQVSFDFVDEFQQAVVRDLQSLRIDLTNLLMEPLFFDLPNLSPVSIVNHSGGTDAPTEVSGELQPTSEVNS